MADAPQPQQQTVFECESKQFYRIPALLYERESDTLLAFAELRKTLSDVDAKALVMKKGVLKEESPNVKTITWSELKQVEQAHIPGYRPMNPCPLYDNTNKTLFLFFNCIEGEVPEGWQIKNLENKTRLCYIKSTDAGETWSDLIELSDQRPTEWLTTAVGPGHGLQTEGGRLIVPVHTHTQTDGSKKTGPYAVSLYSDDHGESWKFGSMFETLSGECEMAEFFDDRDESVIYCNARTRGGYRVEAFSSDSGESFRALKSEKLVDTGHGCQGSVVSFPAQSEDAGTEAGAKQKLNRWLLYTHPTVSPRNDLGVYLNKSPSNTLEWSKPWIITNGHSGYSELAYIGDGWFVCIVEFGEGKRTQRIVSVVFSYKEVEQGIQSKSLFDFRCDAL